MMTMRRDMDLVRRMLRVSAGSAREVEASVFVDDEHDFQTVAYNIDLIGQAGLAEVSILRDFSDRYFFAAVRRLTWEGCDFLDAFSDDDMWSHIKEKTACLGVRVPFEVLKALTM